MVVETKTDKSVVRIHHRLVAVPLSFQFSMLNANMKVAECLSVENCSFNARVYSYYASWLPISVWFICTYNFTGMVNMFCLIRTTAADGLYINFGHNPFICDCLDFEIYSSAHLFQHGTMPDHLFCEWPLEHRGQMVNTHYFPRLTIGDSSLFAQLFNWNSHEIIICL
jgi:hypothetical protein